VPGAVTATHRAPAVPLDAPDHVQRLTARLLAGEGDLLPVSAFPVDGSFPTATSQYEKRTLAEEIPQWDPDLCIDCGKCALMCPHAAIRTAVAPSEAMPAVLPHKPFTSRDLPGRQYVVQVAPDDCTGCGICVEVCPARSRTEAKHKALDLVPIRAGSRSSLGRLLTLPAPSRGAAAR
jgi:pyruvate-ferredoxin/flavodoxin oxidoreductase